MAGARVALGEGEPVVFPPVGTLGLVREASAASPPVGTLGLVREAEAAPGHRGVCGAAIIGAGGAIFNFVGAGSEELYTAADDQVGVLSGLVHNELINQHEIRREDVFSLILVLPHTLSVRVLINGEEKTISIRDLYHRDPNCRYAMAPFFEIANFTNSGRCTGHFPPVWRKGYLGNVRGTPACPRTQHKKDTRSKELASAAAQFFQDLDMDPEFSDAQKEDKKRKALKAIVKVQAGRAVQEEAIKQELIRVRAGITPLQTRRRTLPLSPEEERALNALQNEERRLKEMLDELRNLDGYVVAVVAAFAPNLDADADAHRSAAEQAQAAVERWGHSKDPRWWALHKHLGALGKRARDDNRDIVHEQSIGVGAMMSALGPRNTRHREICRWYERQSHPISYLDCATRCALSAALRDEDGMNAVVLDDDQERLSPIAIDNFTDPEDGYNVQVLRAMAAAAAVVVDVNNEFSWYRKYETTISKFAEKGGVAHAAAEGVGAAVRARVPGAQERHNAREAAEATRRTAESAAERRRAALNWRFGMEHP